MYQGYNGISGKGKDKMIWTIDDIKTQDHLALYGWELRLLEIDEAISLLEKERKKVKMYYDSLSEKVKNDKEKLQE